MNQMKQLVFLLVSSKNFNDLITKTKHIGFQYFEFIKFSLLHCYFIKYYKVNTFL